MIMLGTGSSTKTRGYRPKEIADVEQGLYVYVKDLDAHYGQAAAHGAELLLPVEPTDYGLREYSAVDPGGIPFYRGSEGETDGSDRRRVRTGVVEVGERSG